VSEQAVNAARGNPVDAIRMFPGLEVLASSVHLSWIVNSIRVWYRAYALLLMVKQSQYITLGLSASPEPAASRPPRGEILPLTNRASYVLDCNPTDHNLDKKLSFFMIPGNIPLIAHRFGPEIVFAIQKIPQLVFCIIDTSKALLCFRYNLVM